MELEMGALDWVGLLILPCEHVGWRRWEDRVLLLGGWCLWQLMWSSLDCLMMKSLIGWCEEFRDDALMICILVW